MIWAVIIVATILIVTVILCVMDSTREINKANARIDGLHERIDSLRDFIMQKIENDYHERLKK
jgi:hypothetical protein